MIYISCDSLSSLSVSLAHFRLKQNLDADYLGPKFIGERTGRPKLAFEGTRGECTLMVGVEYGCGHIVLVAKECRHFVSAQFGEDSPTDSETVSFENDTVYIWQKQGNGQLIVFDEEIAVSYPDMGRFSDAYCLP